MKSPTDRPMSRVERLKKDGLAGLVLGCQSVPDGLASGLIAGVNPANSLYGYLFGMLGAALVTSSEFMTVQATGAMAAVVADIPVVHSGDDADAALFTLAVMTGLVMIVAGRLGLGRMLRFVSNTVLVGFVSGVGLNIIFGQLSSFTGYDAQGANRILRVIDLLLHFWRIDLMSLLVGVATVVLIVLFGKLGYGPIGLVVSIVAMSGLSAAFGLDVAVLRDIAAVPSGLPSPVLPDVGLVAVLLMPAFSLAFVGLVQGAAITANYTNSDGSRPDASQDFTGQGVGNVLSGLFQGMPVGGSMSATSVVTSAGSVSRHAQIVASGVMAVIVVVFGDYVNDSAMPALAGLLMVVGYRSIKFDDMVAVMRTGTVQRVTLLTTLILTLLVPLQFAVLVGVGVSILLFVVQESQDLVIRELVRRDDGSVYEQDVPENVKARSVTVLHPYGSLFFASALVLEDFLPQVTTHTDRAVVIIRFRGRSDLGTTLADTLGNFADELHAYNSRLKVVVDNPRVQKQLRVTGFLDVIGEDNIYFSHKQVGESTQEAVDDAQRWIDEDPADKDDAGSPDDPDSPDEGDNGPESGSDDA